MTKPVSAGFRPDVQGLRALAVGLVVIYHLYPAALPGGYIGVDVFFVISGFLITGLLVRTFRRTGRVQLLDFWGRRARRLMPAAVLVLAVTWVASRELLPVTQLDSTAQQVRASALYFQNWVLAHDSVDYLKSDQAATPVQHYWSLSVEEQFYVVWPLVFAVGAAVAWLVRRVSGSGGRHRRPLPRPAGQLAGRTTVLVLALAILGASLWFSAYETANDPAAAYFVTTTRMWELAVGGVLALLGARLTNRIGRVGALAWVGLAMIVVSAFTLTDGTSFPGLVALLPVGGAALLLVAGSASGRFGTSPLTSSRPAVFLGDISYSLYLWHWPVIVLTKAYTGHDIGPRTGPLVVAVSVTLAYLTKRFVEDPVRTAGFITRSRVRSLATATVAIIPVALVSVWISSQPTGSTKLDARHQGAAALAQQSPSASASTSSASTKPVDTAKLVPALARAAEDRPQAMGPACESNNDQSQVKICTFGETKDPAVTVAVVGDSHMAMWSEPLIKIAKKHRWKLVYSAKGGCPITTTVTSRPGTGVPFDTCTKWGTDLMDKLVNDIKPDIVLTHARASITIAPDKEPTDAHLKKIAAGMAENWQRLEKNGIDVVGMADTPEQGQNIPQCLAGRNVTLAKCSRPEDEALGGTSLMRLAAKDAKGAVPLVDMTPQLCDGKVCPAVVGNVIVYLDSHHLSATYTKTLEPFLEKRLLATRPVEQAMRAS